MYATKLYIYIYNHLKSGNLWIVLSLQVNEFDSTKYKRKFGHHITLNDSKCCLFNNIDKK